MAFDSGLLLSDALSATDDAYLLELRLPWMRSLPWSCLVAVSVTIDGKEVDAATLEFRIDDSWVPVVDLADRIDEYWIIGRPVHVRVPAHPRPVGDTVRVELAVQLRIPYILFGPKALVLPARRQADLTIRASERTVDARP